MKKLHHRRRDGPWLFIYFHKRYDVISIAIFTPASDTGRPKKANFEGGFHQSFKGGLDLRLLYFLLFSSYVAVWSYFDDPRHLESLKTVKMYLSLCVSGCVGLGAYFMADRLIGSGSMTDNFIKAGLFGKDLNKSSENKV